VQRFIALRHSTPALRRGDFRVLHAADQIVVYQRRYNEETAVIAFNPGDKEATFSIHQTLPESLRDALDPAGTPLLADKPNTLAPRSGRVWVTR
jgi:cyclomaltodextrinase / maltogenic alpha-amylase / neopullulanase